MRLRPLIKRSLTYLPTGLSNVVVSHSRYFSAVLRFYREIVLVLDLFQNEISCMIQLRVVFFDFIVELYYSWAYFKFLVSPFLIRLVITCFTIFSSDYIIFGLILCFDTLFINYFIALSWNQRIFIDCIIILSLFSILTHVISRISLVLRCGRAGNLYRC